MENIFDWTADPAAWTALVTLVVMEIVLGVDNLIFISILSNKLPEHQRSRARRIGISLALVMRLILLSTLAWLVGLTQTVFSLPWSGPLDASGHPSFELSFSWRDLILIAGGLFLLWKATTEIHEKVDVNDTGLGLPIAKWMIEKHGGTIGLTSAEGPTEVRIRLPIVA